MFSHTGPFIIADQADQQTIALDGDVRLATGGVDDVRLAALGRVGPIPRSVFTSTNGVINYTADHPPDRRGS